MKFGKKSYRKAKLPHPVETGIYPNVNLITYLVCSNQGRVFENYAIDGKHSITINVNVPKHKSFYLRFSYSMMETSIYHELQGNVKITLLFPFCVCSKPKLSFRFSPFYGHNFFELMHYQNIPTNYNVGSPLDLCHAIIQGFSTKM